MCSQGVGCGAIQHKTIFTERWRMQHFQRKKKNIFLPATAAHEGTVHCIGANLIHVLLYMPLVFIIKIPLALMGVLASRSAPTWPFARLPLNTSVIFSTFFKITFKHLHQPLRSESQGLGTLRQLLKSVPSVTHQGRAQTLPTTKVGDNRNDVLRKGATS
jgi:hypothetical protein